MVKKTPLQVTLKWSSRILATSWSSANSTRLPSETAAPELQYWITLWINRIKFYASFSAISSESASLNVLHDSSLYFGASVSERESAGEKLNNNIIELLINV